MVEVERREMKMTDTLNDTFSSFFDDTPNTTCEFCDATENLAPVGSATGGAQMWICPVHKVEMVKADHEQIQKEQDEIARIVAMMDE